MSAPSEELPCYADSLPDAALAHICSFLERSDLASVEQTCRSFLRVVNESRSWLRLACRSVDGLSFAAAAGVEAKPLARKLLEPPAPASLIAEALSASTTDNPPENIGTTLSKQHRNRPAHVPCYWSSRGSADARGEDWLVYRLCAPLCVVTSFALRPYKADFQRGHPVYAPLRVRFMAGEAAEALGGYGFRNAAAAQQVCWTFESADFECKHSSALQVFTLPRPVLCAGGVVRFQLVGRHQTQTLDNQWYVCIAHARCNGTPLYRYALQPDGRLAYLSGGPSSPALLPSSSSDDSGSDGNSDSSEDSELD
jgi:hypothetical protein